MFSATAEQQQKLLLLSEIDLHISRQKSKLRELETSTQVDTLRRDLLAAAEALLQEHSKREQLSQDLIRVETDADLVEKRIKQDQQKAKEVSSDRELKAVESELLSLRARKSELEDTELELMESIQNSEDEIKKLTQSRTTLNTQMEEELSKLHEQSLELSSSVSDLVAKRDQLKAQIDGNLLLAYERKSQRGIAVGQTLGRDCSACRLAINGTQVEAIMALPQDELPTCPNCDAFIVR